MRKVLIIDDDEDILFSVELILRKEGLEPITSTKAEMFFQMVENHQPDLILMDIYMGRYDGRNLCLTLKSNPAYKELPVLLFSANYKFMSDFPRFKADGFLAKPFSIKQLLNTIHAFIKN